MIERPSANPPVPAPTAILSAVGVWVCYYILVTARSLIVDEHAVDLLALRILVVLAGMGITLLIWQVLRALDARPLSTKIAAILLLALPGSLAIAFVNERAFSGLDKSYSILNDVPAPPDLPLPPGPQPALPPGALPPGVPQPPSPPAAIPPGRPKGTIRLERDSDGAYIIQVPGAPIVVVRDPRHDDPKSYWKGLSEIAIGRYFVLLAWSALFLALANAERVRAAERREAELRRAAKAAELRSLRYQVNPHFLFNTLNSLSALVLTGKTDAAERMIQSLAGFYRTSLTGDPTIDVPLSDEMRLQQLYLEVEGVRFPERLKVAIELPDALANACVPGLILQPLVENAVKHGLAATTRPVTIRIVACEAEGALQVTVSDDGPGTSANGDGCGIGLTNVRDRLNARFGEAASIDVTEGPGGFAVTLTMPLTRDGC